MNITINNKKVVAPSFKKRIGEEIYNDIVEVIDEKNLEGFSIDNIIRDIMALYDLKFKDAQICVLEYIMGN